MTSSVRVWDLPTRLFHWLLAACVVALVVTAELGLMVWHFRLGYAVLTLLLFRFIWGFTGGHWSRFASFVYSPQRVLRYLRGRGEPSDSVGHTPTGALAVYAMLFFLLAQVAAGLLSDNEIDASGPFASAVSSSLVSKATWYHAQLGKAILIVLVVLHLMAIGYYLLRKGRNLVRPMLTGDKELGENVPPSRDDARSRVWAVLWLAVCSGLVWKLLSLAPAPL